MGYALDPSLWALAISLSLVAGVWTLFAYRRRGLAAGVRGAGWVLVPFAALFTGTLTLLLRVLDAVVAWASGLIFSPLMWGGLVLAALAVVLIVAGRRLERRTPAAKVPPRTAATPAATTDDPELAEIEAILRNRGIT